MRKMKRANWFAMTLAACAGGMAFFARGAAPVFDADAFVQRAMEVTPTTPQDEMASLGKTAEENGKAVVAAVARRLADKSAKEDDKLKYVWLDRKSVV